MRTPTGRTLTGWVRLWGAVLALMLWAAGCATVEGAAADGVSAEMTTTAATATPGTEDGSADASTDATDGSGTPTGTDMRTVEHFFGVTEVPAQPQRIVTPTQDQNALLPLLELGVRPVGSAGHVLDDGSQVFRRVDEYDTSGIAWIGPYGSEVDFEATAALDPDLIVVEEFGGEGNDDRLSQIAPTVGVQVFGRPLTDALMDFAHVVGETEAAEALRDEYVDRVNALLTDLGDRRDTLSVSVITAGDPGQFYRADSGQAVGTVMADLDLARPEPQSEPYPSDFDAVSIENLGQHDADVLLLIDFSGEDQDPGIDALTGAPTWERLAAVGAGQAYTIDGIETVGAAWGKMDNFLADLEAILLADDVRDDVVSES